MNEREYAELARRIQDNLEEKQVNDPDGKIAAVIVDQIGRDRRMEAIGKERRVGTIIPTSATTKLKEYEPAEVKPASVEAIKGELKKELGNGVLSKLEFSVTTNTIEIKPAAYLGKPLFADIANILGRFDAQYVSEGKNSRWRVAK